MITIENRSFLLIISLLLLFIQLSAQTNIVGSQTSNYYERPGLTETWIVSLNSGASGLYGSPAVIDFNFGMNNLNNALQSGSSPNASPWIDVRLYVNDRLIWDAQSPNDNNHESGDFHIGSGSTLLSGPNIPWSLCVEATCLNHNVRIQLPSNIGPITNVYFTFNAGEDDAQVRVNSLTATQINAIPVATNDDVAICGNASGNVNIDVLSNDSDGDGDPLTLTIVSGPTNGGTASVVNGQIRYTPPNPVVSNNSITYQICDPTNACATATVNIIRDFDEMTDDCDFDGDGIINSIDIDDDNDGVLDTQENQGCPTTVNKSNITVNSNINWNGQLSRVVDGNFTNNLWAELNQDISGRNYLVFDMGSAIALSTIELANHTTGILQQGSTLRVQGSNNNSNWTNLGGVITIGPPNATGVLTGRVGAANFEFANTTAYRYYRLRGLSGTTINWYLQEANFEVSPCDDDGDGVANSFDLDSDGDGCPDAAESGAGSVGTLISGEIVNGSGGSNTTSTVGNAIVQGPYGNNGLANDVETADGAGASVTYTVSGNYLDAAIQSGCRNCNITDEGLAGAPFCVNGGNDTNDNNDFIRFTINPTGTELNGGSYTLSVVGGAASFVGGNNGSYGSRTTFRLNSGTANGNTNYMIRITDNDDPNCTHDFPTGIVSSCSALPRNCSITNEGLEREAFCVNGGNDTNESNDFIRFRINPTGTDLTDGTYTLSANNGGSFVGSSGNSGVFGAAKTFRMHAGSADGSSTYTITITDDTDPTCIRTFDVGPLGPCSIDSCDAASSGNLDSDGDGVADICDIDDDNDGILDADECLGELMTSISQTASGTVISAENAVGFPDGISARLDPTGVIVLELSSTLNAGEELSLFMARVNTVGRAVVGAGTSVSGPFVDEIAYDDFGVVGQIDEQIYTLNSDGITHIQIRRTNGRVFIDGVQALEEDNCDSDGDGITNRLDLDSDGDGCFDALEAGHTESVNNSGEVDGPFGNNGLDNDLENSDIFSAGINYTIASSNSGKSQFLDSTNKDACCTVTDVVPDFQDSIVLGCFGDQTDLTTLTNSNTIPTGATIVWFDTNSSTGTQVVDPTAVDAGSYFAFYFDNTNNCYSDNSDEVMVIQPAVALNATINTIVAESCAGRSDGAIDINITGGTSPYTFLWNNGAITEDLAHISAGTYDVGVTDNNGCVFNLTNIVVTVPSSTILEIKAFIEGAYDPSNDSMTTRLNDLHLLPGQDFSLSGVSTPGMTVGNTAAGQPYNRAPWNYAGTEGDKIGDPSLDPERRSYPANTVDWILISVRQATFQAGNEIWKCAGLLQSDGNVDIPSECPCLMVNGSLDEFYVVVEHRNHLPIMSNPITVSGDRLVVDFTISDSWRSSLFGILVGVGQKNVNGRYVMHSGNPVSNPYAEENDINSLDQTSIDLSLDISDYEYLPEDLNFDATVDIVDRKLYDINSNLFTVIPH